MPGDSIPRQVPKRLKNLYAHKDLHTNTHSRGIRNSPNVDNPNAPIIHMMNGQTKAGIHTVEYYSAKRNAVLIRATTRTNSVKQKQPKSHVS